MFVASASGGGKLKKALEQKIGELKKYEAHIGILAGATAQSAEYSKGATLAERAFYNEFGAHIPVTMKMRRYFVYHFGVQLKTNMITIPARPFMRNTLQAHKSDWARQVQALVQSGKYTAKESLQLVGDIAVKDIVQTIEAGVPPANSPFTKRFGKWNQDQPPLIHTGDMQKAIHCEVVTP